MLPAFESAEDPQISSPEDEHQETLPVASDDSRSCNYEHEERVYDTNGKLHSKTLSKPGEKLQVHYDQQERVRSEDLRICGDGKADYTCHTDFEYDKSGYLKRRLFHNSLSEKQIIEYGCHGLAILETIERSAQGKSVFTSCTRFEYHDNGKLKLRFYEDSSGEKRRTEYDTEGRKKIEDIRVMHPGQIGYVARTEFAYTTTEVFFGSDKP